MIDRYGWCSLINGRPSFLILQRFLSFRRQFSVNSNSNAPFVFNLNISPFAVFIHLWFQISFGSEKPKHDFQNWFSESELFLPADICHLLQLKRSVTSAPGLLGGLILVSPPWGGKIVCADSSPVLFSAEKSGITNLLIAIVIFEIGVFYDFLFTSCQQLRGRR